MISSAGAAWCAAAGVCKRAAAGVQCGGWRKRSGWRARGWASGWFDWLARAAAGQGLRAFVRLCTSKSAAQKSVMTFFYSGAGKNQQKQQRASVLQTLATSERAFAFERIRAIGAREQCTALY